MATAISTTNHHLHSDALPLLDLRLLSHSDLLSLSLSSSSSLPLQNDADLSTPKIDRSVFNESAGSRKQTFSRLRLAPPRNNYSQFASNSKSSFPDRNQNQNQTNVVEIESSEIVSLLKSFFGCENADVEENYESAPPLLSDPVALPFEYGDALYLNKTKDVNVNSSVSADSGAKKRKRGRPRKDARNLGVVSKSEEIVVFNDVEKEGEVAKVSREGGERENALLESAEGVKVEREDVRLESVEDVKVEGGNARLESMEDVNVEGEKARLESVEDVKVEGGNARLESADDVNVEGGKARLESGEDVNAEGASARLETAEHVNAEGGNALLESAEDVNARLETAEDVNAEGGNARLETAEDGNAERGNARLQTAEDGNAEGGNARLETAEDGNAEGGNARLESAEDGNAEGGNARLESAEDVNAEGGNARLETVEDVNAEGGNARLETAQDVNAEGENARLETAQDVNAEGENARLETAQDVNAEGENARLESAEDVNAEGGNARLESIEDINQERENARLEITEVVNVKRENAQFESREDVDVNVSVHTEFGAKKRKRGRPRKDERNVRVASKNKVIVAYNDVKKEEVGERENVQEEDPYGDELRRRTEGMQTKGELVGYLEGVEGAWISGRKKSRVVNAAEFGGVLPMGWKLMISVKRRAGFAWLSCKRYISPNGLQFVSCKEASSYLHSLSGFQDATLTNSGQKDTGVYLTHNLSPGNAADSSVKDDKNADEPVCGSAVPISPGTDKVEKQTTSLKIGSSSEVPGWKKYKCHKCTMTFNEPDDLLQHLQMSHQRVPKRFRHAASVAEEAIMIDGKYQCQLCHKTYEERHRFNGHLGNHIKDYLKRLDVSVGVSKSQKNSMLTSMGVLSIDLMMQPIQHDSNDLKISGAKYSEIQSTTSAETSEGKHGRAFSVGYDVVYEVNEARNAVPAKIDVSQGAEPGLFNECNTILEPSDGKKVIKRTIDGAKNICGQISSQSSSHGTSRDQACTVNNSLNWIPTDLVVDINLEKASVSSFNAPAAVQKSSGDSKPSDVVKVLECSVDESNNVSSQVSSQSSSLGASRDHAGAIKYNLNQTSIDLMEDHNLYKAHVCGSNTQAAMLNTFGDCNIEDGHQSSKIETVNIHKNLVIKEELIAGHDSRGEVVANDVIGNKKRKKFAAPPSNNRRDPIVNKSNSLLPSTMRETFCKRGSKGGLLSCCEEKADICRSDVCNVTSGALNEFKFDELGKSGINDQSIEYGANSTETIEEIETSKGERSYGNYSAVASLDCTPDVDDNIYGTFKSTGNLPCPEKGTDSTRLNLSSSKQSLGFKPDIVKVNSAAEVQNQNRFTSSENEFIGGSAFGSRSETNTQLHNSSSVWVVPPANSQIFPSTNYGNFNRNPVEKLTPYRNPVEKLTRYKNPVEKLTPYRNPVEKLTPCRNPDSSLHRPSDCKQTHYDKNSVNGSRTESYKHNEVKRSCNAESHIGFGHGGTEPESNVSFEAAQESDSKEYPFYPPGYQPTVHTEQPAALYGGNMHTQKQTRNSTDGLSWLSGKEQPQIVENNLNWDFMGGNDTEPRLEDSKNPRKNEALNGFNNQILSNEQPLLDFMWRNDDLLRGFVDTSSHVGQTAGGFPACDVMSDKGQSAFFAEKFDSTSAFEGLRSGGMGNMEFNFLSSLMDSPSSEPKTDALNAGVAAQGYGSSVWPQKDALPLLPKMARQHRSMCSYCRNEFQHDSFESAAQADSMGFVCASCKAKFSSPFNFF